VNEHDEELSDRLRDLGRRPIDDATQQLHQRRIDAAVDISARPRRRFGVASVAAACVVGFFVGSAGLAMADALPDSAQEVAHDVLGVVQVDVPPGKEDKRGPCVAEAAKLEDKEAKQAAKEACPDGGGAPKTGTGSESSGRSDEAPGQTGETSPGTGKGSSKHEGDPCHGRPPWAGDMSKEARDAAKQAASREACPPDSDVEDATTAGERAEPTDTIATTTIAEQPPTTVPEDTPPTTVPDETPSTTVPEDTPPTT
jgi:hypothetical protein